MTVSNCRKSVVEENTAWHRLADTIWALSQCRATRRGDPLSFRGDAPCRLLLDFFSPTCSTFAPISAIRFIRRSINSIGYFRMIPTTHHDGKCSNKSGGNIVPAIIQSAATTKGCDALRRLAVYNRATYLIFTGEPKRFTPNPLRQP